MNLVLLEFSSIQFSSIYLLLVSPEVQISQCKIYKFEGLSK